MTVGFGLAFRSKQLQERPFVAVREDVLMPFAHSHVLRGSQRDPFRAGRTAAFTQESSAIRRDRPQQIVRPVVRSPGNALLLAFGLHSPLLPAPRPDWPGERSKRSASVGWVESSAHCVRCRASLRNASVPGSLELDSSLKGRSPALGCMEPQVRNGSSPHTASRTLGSVRSGSGGLGAHSGCPGAGVNRLPDAQIEIQLKTRCRIVNRNRFAKASLERPLAGGRDLKTEATEELGKVLAHRRVAELNFDAARTTPRLPQADHPPNRSVVSFGGPSRPVPAYSFGERTGAERSTVGSTGSALRIRP
jgi:hypothetical protein